MEVKFNSLSIGDSFGCWGHIHAGYPRPLWIGAEKLSFNSAKDLNGNVFNVNEDEKVSI